MAGVEWWEPIKTIGAALAVVLIGVSGFWKGKRSGLPATEHSEVVAATFVERSLMESLIRSLNASTEMTGRLVELLEADAQRRHDEALIRDELRRRGIPE